MWSAQAVLTWPDGGWERYPQCPGHGAQVQRFGGVAQRHIFGISCLCLTSNSLLSGCMTLKSPL